MLHLLGHWHAGVPCQLLLAILTLIFSTAETATGLMSMNVPSANLQAET